MRAGESDIPAPGKFELLSLDVHDLPDGTQRIHLNASRYDDTINESWYIARPKSIEPLYHRQHVGIGVGIAAAFGAVIPTAVISPIVAAPSRCFSGDGTASLLLVPDRSMSCCRNRRRECPDRVGRFLAHLEQRSVDDHSA